MMILLIGGTQGFGKALADQLRGKGHDLVTVGRSGGDYQVDVSDADAWKETLAELSQQVFDAVIFCVGYARAMPLVDQDPDVIKQHYDGNLGYVLLALDVLKLAKDAVVATVGSQWSYKYGDDFLKPYIVSKHELVRHTKEYATYHRHHSVVHIALPPMKTPQRDLGWSSHDRRPESISDIEFMAIEKAAERFVEVLFQDRYHGELVQIMANGSMYFVEG